MLPQVVAIRKCQKCTITLASDASVVKVQLEGCTGCEVKLHGRCANFSNVTVTVRPTLVR